MTIEDQPPPIATDRPASWDLVISDVMRVMRDPQARPFVEAVLGDMRERDQMGAAKYGVRHTSHNGRNHLVDAYQEALDLVVYVRAELEERGVSQSAPTPPGSARLAKMYATGLAFCVGLRMELDEAKNVATIAEAVRLEGETLEQARARIRRELATLAPQG